MMDIKRVLLVTSGAIVVSLFFFQVTFAAFPVTNSKNLLAALGLALATVNFDSRYTHLINKGLLNIIVIASLVSLVGLFSVTLNNTPDYEYATYIVSFFVWVFAAYFTVNVIKWIHGELSVRVVCNYLILVSVLQCISVLLIDTYPSFENIVNNNFVGLAEIGKIERKYGIGAWLDVGGSRFAVVLIIISYLLTREKVTSSIKAMLLYIIAFIFIFIVGSMVGRTTSVGGGVGLAYLLWYNRASILSPKNRKFVFLSLMMAIAGVAISVYYYNNNAAFKENVRFAFEGFFNLWEKGEWQTTSTDRWQTMFIWPDNLKTWIMGDGYFAGPSDIDPYYLGPFNPGFYKWTDIGYLRFIFYFGLLGLSLFIIYFCKVTEYCISRFKEYKSMFLLLLLFTFVLWFKVSTDIFPVFALFICIPQEDNEEYDKYVAIDNEDTV